MPMSDLSPDYFNRPLAEVDPEIADVLARELDRQRRTLEMIASENFVPQAVLECQGSVLTNKYAEGYPGKRYYGGCEHVDVAENLAIERVKKLFDCDFANVQPHSGAQANAAVFMALVSPGDTVMGMNLAQGGHLTHGNPANFSGKYYKIVPYGLNEKGYIDYDEMERIALQTKHKTLRGPRGGIILAKGQGEDLYKKLNSAVFPGTQGGPLMHVIAAKAVAFGEALRPSFRSYAKAVVENARALAEIL